MRTDKYYDWSRGTAVREADGCPYTQWQEQSAGFTFALHPKGFLVFLPSGDIDAADEYAADDPYSIQVNIDSPFHRRRIEATIHLLQSAFEDTPGDLRILDIGCGEGYITREIKRALPRAEVSGLDHSITAIARAAEQVAGIEFVVANAYSPPYCPDYFDAVVCNNLWEHLPDPLSLLARIRRVTHPGGCLVISTPSRYRLGNLVRVATGRPIRFMSKHHVTEYSVGQVIEQLRFGGYELVRAHSRPIGREVRTIRRLLGFTLLKPLAGAFLALVRSHHVLEETVFFLARKVDD